MLADTVKKWSQLITLLLNHSTEIEFSSLQDEIEYWQKYLIVLLSV